MMDSLVLATKNLGKVKEFQSLLHDIPIQITTLNDYPNIGPIKETGVTFLENATIKATTVARLTNCLSLADDSGLVVPALNGAPGVYSARYAGNDHDDQANNNKLLEDMRLFDDEDRKASFQCYIVIAHPDGRIWSCHGSIYGQITRQAQGNNGFGYDPLFYIPSKNATMAELSTDEKNAISHRGKAVNEAVQLIRQLL